MSLYEQNEQKWSGKFVCWEKAAESYIQGQVPELIPPKLSFSMQYHLCACYAFQQGVFPTECLSEITDCLGAVSWGHLISAFVRCSTSGFCLTRGDTAPRIFLCQWKTKQCILVLIQWIYLKQHARITAFYSSSFKWVWWLSYDSWLARISTFYLFTPVLKCCPFYWSRSFMFWSLWSLRVMERVPTAVRRPSG